MANILSVDTFKEHLADIVFCIISFCKVEPECITKSLADIRSVDLQIQVS